MSWHSRQWRAPWDFSRLEQNPKAPPGRAAVAIAVFLLIWLVVSSYYTVQANEQALVLRFGKDAGISGPGLHLKLPFGVDRVKKVEVKEIKREEFGFRTERPGIETTYAVPTSLQQDEARILTGDLNILILKWVVRYKIKDIRQYFFSLRDPATTIRDVSEAAMRMVVGDSSVDETLTIGRGRIQEEVRDQIQRTLDSYEAGISVVDVRLKDVNPPDMVKDAFDAVNTARQQKEQIINEAEAERNSKIPEAQGKKFRVIEEARGYALKRVNEATGDANRFLKLYSVYQKDPEVTERRLYLESMKQVLAPVKRKYIVEGGTGDVLKLLNLTATGPQEGGKR